MKSILFFIFLFPLLVSSQIIIKPVKADKDFSGNILNFGVFSDKLINSDTLMLVNQSGKTLSLQVKSIPDNIKSSFMSGYIFSDDTAYMVLNVSSQKKVKYGPNSDKIILNTSDSINPKLVFYANYFLVNDFSLIDSIGKANKPVISIKDSVIHLGLIHSLEEKPFTILIKNNGLSDLVIQRVKLPLGISGSRPRSIVVKPNQDFVLDLFCNPGVEKGNFDKTLLLISNDPDNTVLRIRISANVK